MSPNLPVKQTPPHISKSMYICNTTNKIVLEVVSTIYKTRV